MIDVVVAGHLALDMHPAMGEVTMGALVIPGRLLEIGSLGLALGGAVGNTGLTLHQLGVKVGLMANVGDDFVGRTVISILESYDPALSRYIQVHRGESSAYTIVLTPEQIDRIFLSHVTPNEKFGFKSVDYSVLKETKIFHLGYPSLLPRMYADGGEELAAIMQGAKGAGAVTSLDMTLPDVYSASGQADWKGIFRKALPFVDIFLPSIEEIVFCIRRTDYEAWRGEILEYMTAEYLADMADELLDMGCAIAGFKMGHLGMYLKTGDATKIGQLKRLSLNMDEWTEKTAWSPAFDVRVIGTTGAGDSSYGGLLTALLHEMTPSEAVRSACAVGACNVEAADSISGIRSWDATQTRIGAGWETRQETLRNFQGNC